MGTDQVADELGAVRGMWRVLEPLHAGAYFAAESIGAMEALGYDVSTRWPRYFALRAAPLGPVGPQAVTAAFYSFAPAAVAEHVPAVWRVAPPAEVLRARYRGIDGALRSLLGDAIGTAELEEAADLAREAALAADLGGRPLAAANADLTWPQEPHLVLWHAATILREHRGDGHLMALRVAGLDGAEALDSIGAVKGIPDDVLGSRGWDAAAWEAARARLADRGWLDAGGAATDAGRDGRAALERRTDELAAGPWRALGPARTRRLAELTGPLTGRVVASGLLPATSTLGLR